MATALSVQLLLYDDTHDDSHHKRHRLHDNYITDQRTSPPRAKFLGVPNDFASHVTTLVFTSCCGRIPE